MQQITGLLIHIDFSEVVSVLAHTPFYSPKQQATQEAPSEPSDSPGLVHV